MLLFIYINIAATDAGRAIQIHLMLLFIRHKRHKHKPVLRFKYISCYCLSDRTEIHRHAWKQFKYISCYCLSSAAISSSFRLSNSNTSHVIVYLDGLVFLALLFIQIHLMLLFILLPVSHQVRSVKIQIHLMLLFILPRRLVYRSPVKFKYISCYCLSTLKPVSGRGITDSNTSHVIVYRFLSHIS